MTLDEQEQWKQIEDFPNYLVSTFGRVYNQKHQRFLRTHFSFDGYEQVGIYRDGFEFKIKIHRLVALAFIPKRIDANDVNHLDGDKTNNFVWNLEWVTKSENLLHAYRTGLRRPSVLAGRKRIPVRIVETGEVFEDQHACALAINGHQSSISQCLNGKLKTHRGYTFEYVTEEALV